MYLFSFLSSQETLTLYIHILILKHDKVNQPETNSLTGLVLKKKKIVPEKKTCNKNKTMKILSSNSQFSFFFFNQNFANLKRFEFEI